MVATRTKVLIALLLVVAAAWAWVYVTGLGNGPSTLGGYGQVMVPRCETGALVVATRPVGAQSLQSARRVPFAGGRAEMAVGEYALLQCRIIASDAKGSWTAQGQAPTGIMGGPQFNVAEGSSASLEIGPPFTASIKVESRGSTPSFSLKIVDKTGMEYSVRGTGSPTPSVQALDESGKVVWQQAMEFG